MKSDNHSQYFIYIKKETCPGSISKFNSNCGKQTILIVISNVVEDGWHYLAVKKTVWITKKIISNYDGDFYCLNCLHSFRTKNKLSLMK